MATLIKVENVKEGEIFCKWLRSRMIDKNKNVLGVELGATGTGKSYRDLRKAELWYNFYFKEPFPTENICFGTLKVMERISSGKLRKGEVIIFEESGVSLGSLDFQTKVSKMFTYVLQSFRSMNIAIFFNLPYLSMLNKSARMLMHYYSQSLGIDHEKNLNKCKFFLVQVNQMSGKVYPKYPKIRHKGSKKKIKKFAYSLPSKYIIDAYESKKIEYISSTTKEFTEKMRAIEEKDKPKRKELLPHQLEIYKLNQEGFNQQQIADKLGKTQPSVNKILKTCRKYGYEVKIQSITKNPQEIKENDVYN